ncbi:glycosyltransferase family 2 protein [Coraliomargarita sp. SDUM461004]|uniref:Glycosyltransferase family 2 protein n=1 Tax=Thalassobacterium sedimentorum TaxID=3041258 RepID=A0ABU1AL91_9BACT|nr:glycosyltransferase family 2 protein [Coraliomargarita sp. SDUM461004]MDQ8195568.1 glycosyltransferase family 2 protein [Coraliomargarita sp. SDUM461004]
MSQEPNYTFAVDTAANQNFEQLNREQPKLSLVIPCYNEEEVLPETIKRLSELMTQLCEKGKIAPDSAVVFVDDGSRDRTWQLIVQQADADALFRGLKLSRNRGHQHALLAGLHTVDGDAIISIDADLQDDIRVIEDMVDAYRQGDDVVYGVRKERTTDSFFKRATAEGYYKLLAMMGVELVFNHGDYRLLSRTALEALKKYDEVNLFIRGVIPTLGFRSSEVEYARDERFAGESKYPIHKMLSLAIQGITSFSAIPLRIIAMLGLTVSGISVVMVIWALFTRLLNPEAVPGWASSVIPIYFIGGIQLLSIGVLGEYVSKIYMETKRRPRFLIDRIK